MWKIDPDGALTVLTGDVGDDVWVPSEQVAFHHAGLPPGRQKMWEQTVAFVLEEQVVASVDDQHFVIGRAGDAGEEVPVAVVGAEAMQAWSDAWHERGLKPRAVCPDVLAVPLEEGRAVLWHEGGRCLLRFDAQTGMAGSPEWIRSVLEVGDQAGDVRVFSDDPAALPEAWRECAEALPGSLDERMLAGPDQGAAAMNFLQGAFRPVSALAAWGRAWEWAGAAAVVAFALYMGMLAVETRMMIAATDSLKQTTVALYKQHFPEQELVTDLQSQVERRMAQLKGGIDKRETSPWQTLARVEPLISSCKACRVEEVEFTQTSISLVISSSAELDGLLQRIGALEGVEMDSAPLPDAEDRKQLRVKLEMKEAA